MYKDREKQKEANRLAKRKQRGYDVKGMTKDSYQQLLGIERGKKLDRFVSKGANLEKLQRICGSLGKYAEDVWLGELNLKTIGSVIGTKPGLHGKGG